MPRKSPVLRVNEDKMPTIRRQKYGSRAGGGVRVSANEVNGILAVQGVKVFIRRGKIVVIRERDNAPLRVQKTGQGIDLVDRRGRVFTEVVPTVTAAPVRKGPEDSLRTSPLTKPRIVQPARTEPAAPKPTPKSAPKPTPEARPEKRKRLRRWFL